MLTIKRFTVNLIEENCYILSDETREAVIIDCGALFPAEQETLRAYITEGKLTPRHLLCTHGHFDHVFGAQFVADTYGLQPEICADDLDTYAGSREQMRLFIRQDIPFSLPAPGPALHDGDTIAFGSHTLRVIATPGHTPGGVCFYCAEENALISGDSLFRHEIGRCDLPGGDERALVSALKRRLLVLPGQTKVYPGHGPATTIAEERAANPYLQ